MFQRSKMCRPNWQI